MKKILILFGMCILFMQIVSAVTLPNPYSVYLEVNKTYPLILIPLDENVWNITLNVYDGNWTTLNFTWTGSQYELNILFNTIGDYPFVINSTEVEGDITGTFLVREVFDVTFRFYRDKRSYVFFSNKYINEMSYVTAELTGERTMFQNNYDDTLEPFFAPLLDDRFRKPVWYAKYNNGEATLRLYEKGEYAIRLIDGEIEFTNEYSVPNITESYGINAYIGKYNLNNSTSYDILLETKDLHPYRWLFNWLLIIGVIGAVAGAIALFFVVPELPMLSFAFGIGFSVLFVILRIVIFVWRGL